MDNETKLSAGQINSIKQDLADSKENVNIQEFMNKHLNQEQKEQVSAIVSDPEKLRALLNSPLAQKLMERFNKQEKE